MRYIFSKEVVWDSNLPDKIEAWLYDNCFRDHRYMFFENTNLGYIGHCSNCHQNVWYEKSPKRGKFGFCPKCETRVKYRSMKDRLTFQDIDYFAYIENGMQPNMYRVRYFTVWLETNFLDYYIHYREEQRDIYCSVTNEHKEYHRRIYGLFAGLSSNKWVRGDAGFQGRHIAFQDLTLYHRNIRNVFRNDKVHKYNALDILAESKAAINPLEFLKNFFHCPKVELIIKSGLTELFQHFSFKEDRQRYHTKTRANYNIYGESLAEFLMLQSKLYVDFAIKANVSNNELCAVQLAEKMKLEPNETSLKICMKLVKEYLAEDYLIVLKYISYQNFVEYQECVKCSIRDYRDYIENCAKLQYNLSDTAILKPKNFKDSHDRVALLADIEKNKIHNKAIVEMSKAWQKLYSYTSNKFTIVAPKSCQDIIREGKVLGHCVGGYIERVVNRSCIILFLRETSSLNCCYYTIEIKALENGELKVIQARGQKNVSATKEINEFLENWKINFSKRFRKKPQIKVAV